MALDPKVYDYIAQNYGYLAAFLKIPQVGQIIVQAAQQGWDEAKLEGALSKTKWWQTTSAANRQFDALHEMDPATWQAKLNQTTADVSALATKMGAQLSPTDVHTIATDAFKYGLSSTQITDMLTAHVTYKTGGTYKGDTATAISALKQAAADYMVPISDPTMNQWLKGLLSGTQTTDSFKAYLESQAKSLYPTLGAAIDAGVTVRQYVDPYRQLAAQTLEVAPESVDFMQPKWMKAINQVGPNGQRAPMTLSDWSDYLRGLPEYQTTQGAMQQASGFAHAITQTFGKVAGSAGGM